VLFLLQATINKPADMLDQAVLSLPFWSQGFAHIVDMEVTPLRPYESWHEHLKALVNE